MKCSFSVVPQILRCATIFILCSGFVAQAAQPPREFPPGTLTRIEQLPSGRLRTHIEGLPAQARQRALDWLRNFHFTDLDVKSLEVDSAGGVFYVDNFSLDQSATQAPSEPIIAQAAVPVAPFPASLIFHSRLGAPNVLFLNFSGENVSNTEWNNSLGRSLIPAVAFSTDSDYSTYSDAEQAAIKRIWQRVAEDYAPFNIDVTTERPVTFTTRTAHALITRNTDADGNPNPSSSAGGVAYINVFAGSSYASYRPAWIYVNNLGNSESYVAEAASHEVGHNFGLSHDGTSDGSEYYGGHGTGDTSWGPIMGTGYNRNVSQWSKGEYYLANNSQDDLAIIAGKISYRTDDHGDTAATATALVVTGGTNLVSTTPEDDPTNTKPANKGVLERNTDVDVFYFTTGSGSVNLTVNPWIEPSGTRGGNLDLLVELHDANDTVILTSNPAGQTLAQLKTNLTQGTYYLYIRNSGAGDPFSSTPMGCTAYASLGQYFISGYIAPSGAAAQSVQLVASPNNPSWGTVNPTNTAVPAGSTVQVVATPASYYRFVGWTNGVASTNDPLTLVLNANLSIQANFAELLTTNYPTPYWWLAASGYANNFENAVTNKGANGLPLWQSYIAGLNPNDPTSQLRLSLNRGANGTANVLTWKTVTGRAYTLWSSTNLARGFTNVSGASNLPSTVQSFTNSVKPAPRAIFYRLEVRKP
jgi:hypothetical protein